MLVIMIFIWVNHFDGDNFKADALKAAQNLPDNATLDGIGLEHNKCTLD